MHFKYNNYNLQKIIINAYADSISEEKQQKLFKKKRNLMILFFIIAKSSFQIVISFSISRNQM